MFYLHVLTLCGIVGVSVTVVAFKLFETDGKISQKRNRLIGFEVSNRLKSMFELVYKMVCLIFLCFSKACSSG